MSRLIAVTGYKNSGKNAVCNVLRDEFGFKITGMADALKAQMLAIDPWVGWYEGLASNVRLSVVVRDLGWDEAKESYSEIRRLLQKAGTEGGRDIFGQDIWIDTWMKTAHTLLEQGYDVCVSDTRFLNEAAAIRELGGEVWRVYRPGAVAGEHKSERELDSISQDKTVPNDGTLAHLTSRVVGLMTRAELTDFGVYADTPGLASAIVLQSLNDSAPGELG